MTIPDAIDAELARLGKLTPDGIAADLKGRGVKGRRACPWECALVESVKRAVPAVAGELVEIWETDGKLSLEIGGDDYPLPKSVAKFVRRFDEQHYPQVTR